MNTKDELNTLDAEDAHYRRKFRVAARERLRDYVEAVTKPVPRFGISAYVCPCCNSGSGNNGNFTPAFGLFRTQEGELRFKCHACGATGDIFDLAKLVNHLPDFNASERHVADFLGIDLARRTPLANMHMSDAGIPQPPSQSEVLQLKKQANSYIAECRKHADETSFFRNRGFSNETIERFKLGYDPKRQEAVIPFSPTYYVTRSTQIAPDQKGSRKHYKPEGLQQPLFNLAALSDHPEPVFLTESPLDAISIEQAGGRAIALGGTSTTVLSKVLGIYKPGNVFVMAFDTDAPGKRLQEKVVLMLEGRGIPYSLPTHGAFLAYKDANAALMANPELLVQGVAEEKQRAHDVIDERRDSKNIDKNEAVDRIFGATASSVERAVARPFPNQNQATR
ncbi:MAG: toprim domain-containing protein [Eggerthellaceae bacterium]|nr:toprim domain-containing protein [Eggerthellaceae bacterium]